MPTIRSLLPAAVLLLAFALPALAGPALPPTPARPWDFARSVAWEGGEGKGAALTSIRLADHGDFERLVLEFGGGVPGKLPRLSARSESYPERLVLTLDGAFGRTPAAGISYQALRKSRLLSAVTWNDLCGAPALWVVPARPVRWSLSFLPNPSRLVVDIAEGAPPLPDPMYCLQTLPLEGDAACLFLEMVKEESGSAGRLLSTASGKVVGEAGAYGSPEAARKALDALPALRRSFTLQIRARGPLDVPPDAE